jgi:hypothetical protein
MKKIKQCIYTIILLFTCVVASPFIYKQIWDASAEKKKAEKLPPITLDSLSQTATTTSSDVTTVPSKEQPTSADSTAASSETAATTETVTTTTTAPVQTFVKSDPSYFDDALFIGDSRTVGLRDYGTLKNADYFCSVGLASYKVDSEYIDGNNFAGLLQSKRYGKVYIMLGINEVGNDFEYTINAYRSVVDTVKQYQPNAIIVVQANLHVTPEAETSSISNARINYLNSLMAQLADNKTVFYVDVNPIFDDPNGNLREDVSGDGIHFYGNYYPIWCEWLCMNTVAVDNGQSAGGQSTEQVQDDQQDDGGQPAAQ